MKERLGVIALLGIAGFKDPGLDWDQEREVQGRVQDLVLFLESIQTK
jgi:hypothetical protein